MVLPKYTIRRIENSGLMWINSEWPEVAEAPVQQNGVNDRNGQKAAVQVIILNVRSILISAVG